MFIIHLNCPVCAEVREFEQPPCFEHHEPVCPEWACTRCGEAIMLAPLTLATV